MGSRGKWIEENKWRNCLLRGGFIPLCRKYLPKKDFDSKAEEQWRQAVEQIDGYARAPRVDALRQGTQLHKIVMQFSGWDLVRMEEV